MNSYSYQELNCDEDHPGSESNSDEPQSESHEDNADFQSQEENSTSKSNEDDSEPEPRKEDLKPHVSRRNPESDFCENISESDLLAWLFGNSNLLEMFGTDDPVEILAGMDLEQLAKPIPGFIGFEEEDDFLKETILTAKKVIENQSKYMLCGSLDFLAEKLCKTTRQIREYCKDGVVPGAYQTKGGHWRVRYDANTVGQVRKTLGKSVRRRKAGWLIKHLLTAWERPPMSSKEAMYDWEKRIQREMKGLESHLKGREIKPALYSFLAAARWLHERDETVSTTSVARLMGCSRTTVHKYHPKLKQAHRAVAYGNCVLVDQVNTELNNRIGAKHLVDPRRSRLEGHYSSRYIFKAISQALILVLS